MKAFLMYKDRDFDPQLILTQREAESRPWNPNQGPSLLQLLPANEKVLTQDLGLEVVLNAMADGDNFLFEVAKVGILSGVTTVDRIRYRQQALRDCLLHEAMLLSLYRISISAIEGEKNNFWGRLSHYPSSSLYRAVDVMTIFLGSLKRVRAVADQYLDKVESPAFLTLFAMLKRELSDDYLAKIAQQLEELRFRKGVVVSSALGRGNNAADYVLRKPHHDSRSWIERIFAPKLPSYSFKLAYRDEQGARALSEIRDQGINHVANALTQSTDHVLAFFQMLRTELAFYIGCLNLRRRLVAIGEPDCFPIPVPTGERKLAFRGLYDVALALNDQWKVVGNDVNADGKDMIVVTGANTGGKSTFQRSLGIAQLMMQAGTFVPAEAYLAEICDGLFTHFRREEDAAMKSGKFDEELGRMTDIVSQLTPNSMVLFNESFAATNEREGSEIARQITEALVDSGVKVSFVTHQYQFARALYEEKREAILFLKAERKSDGTRTYRMVEGEPQETSYGEDLYHRIVGDCPREKSSLLPKINPAQSLGF